jgi:hypothetical protein
MEFVTEHSFSRNGENLPQKKPLLWCKKHAGDMR